jgi:hypothetical protein
MDAAAANRRSVELSAARRGRSRGLTSDHRGTRRALMVEFYTTVRVTGRRPGARPTPDAAVAPGQPRHRPNHEVVAVGDPAGVHAQLSRVLATPFPEVLYAFEPLTGWGSSSTASSWSGSVGRP